jgi:ElaA protein
MQSYFDFFDHLTTAQLYQILQARIDVFVVEQNCPYPECDDKDQLSGHLRLMDGQHFAPYRAKGIGLQLMQEAIVICEKNYDSPIKISAQAYLEKFYQELGFQTISEPYLEDDIPHIAMLRH